MEILIFGVGLFLVLYVFWAMSLLGMHDVEIGWIDSVMVAACIVIHTIVAFVGVMMMIAVVKGG